MREGISLKLGPPQRYRSSFAAAVEMTPVREHLDQIGYDTVDFGPLSERWRTQPDTAAYDTMYALNPRAWDQGARPASAVGVAEAAASSRRAMTFVMARTARRTRMSRPTATTRNGQP